MLSNEDWTLALVNNLRQWDWELNTKYEIDKVSADALISEYERLQAEIKELRMRVDANKLLGGVL